MSVSTAALMSLMWCWLVQQYTRPCLWCCCLATCSSNKRRTQIKQSCRMTQVRHEFERYVKTTLMFVI